MKKRASHVDRPLALLVFVLVVCGALVFSSAAFGLLARGFGNITSVVFNHLILGIGIGVIALVVTSNIDYRRWRRFAPYIFVLALAATALVFVPQLGIEHGGGRRWIDLFGMSFQPSEALKLGAIIMAAAYFVAIRSNIQSLKYGLGGFLGIIAIPAVLLVLQPDIDSWHKHSKRVRYLYLLRRSMANT